MKRIMRIVISIAALTLLLSAVDHVFAQDRAPQPCTAAYVQLTPYELLGHDHCGNVWKLVLPRGAEPSAAPQAMKDSMGRTSGNQPECWYFSASKGEYMQIPCPSAGDTLGVR